MTKELPREELFSLTSQFQRAADSIVLNIAEGAGSESNKEFSSFLNHGIRSAFECIGCTDIALSNKFLTKELHTRSIESINEIIAMCHGLRRSIKQGKL
jgi:four helix bundle protein